MDDDQFLEAYLNTLEVSEGTEGGDTVTGMATRPYGVKDLLGVNEEDYKDNPRGLAKAVASKNIDELKRMGIDWDNLPASMKFNALDIQFNMGSLNKKAPKYFKAVKAGKYDTAIKESLDAIGAYDPKRKGERPTKGIALRRAMLYNMVADEFNYPKITSINAINQDNPQKSAKVTYNLAEGESIPVTYDTYSLHSTTKPGKVAVSEILGITAQPVTGEDTEDFSEPLPVPSAPKPKPEQPVVPTPQPKPVTPETKTQTDAAFTLDYEDELPDIGDDVPMPDLPATDVAPDTTDAIPPATVDVPEEKNIFERAYDYMFGDDDTPEEIQQREQTRQRLLQSLEMNEGGLASGEIDYSVVDDEYELPTPSDKAREQMKAMGLDAPSILSPRIETRTAEEIAEDRKTLAEVAPITGDILAVKDYPEDISIAKDIIKQGVDEGELSSVLGGVAYAGLSTIGLLPAATGVGAGAKIAKKATKDKLKKELVDEFGTDGATKVVDTVGEASQPVRVTNVVEPKKSVKAYKLFKVDRQGNLYPLFVKMENNKPIELNKWTKAEAGEINQKTGKVKSSLGDLAYRPGFHAGDLPMATHIGGKSGDVKKPNYRPDNQVWAEVEMADDVDWQSVALDRARIKKDGTIDVKTAHITDQLPEGGHYRYKTNPNMTGNWLIGGELKVNRILSDAEVKEINNAAGVADLPRLNELNMNEGGMAMERQMEMFEDGGLMDEGGTVDPLSGNDVPPGSTQEEVRDDIPAQLSEGEFVFPADVVRYIGLEKLMQMRQEAKAGLARMEAMGQMGNSEEAVLPDDIPFDLGDLDMEDEPMEFQVGGLVPNQYGVYQQPSQFASYSQQPYQAPTIPTGQPIQQQPIQAAGFQTLPVQQVPTAPTTVPTFEQLMPTTTGQYDELREYVNEDTGQSMTIPFVDGKPIYPIPQGFTPKPTDQVEAAVPETTTVPTARVAQVSGDDDDRDDGLGPSGGRVGMGGFSDGTGRKQNATIMGVSFDMGEGFIGGAMGAGATALSLATGKPIPAEAKATFTYDNATYTVSGDEYNDLKKSGYTGDLADKIVASLKTESGVRRGTIEYNKETGTFKDKKSGETFQDRDDDNDGIGDILNKSGQSVYNKYNVEDLISGKQKMNQSEKDIASAYNDAQFEAFDFGDDSNDDSGGGAPSGGGRTESAGADWSAGSDFTASEREELGPGSYNAGGLASKKKPKAKKMKQGGMASKK
jgi:hypothetical protein